MASNFRIVEFPSEPVFAQAQTSRFESNPCSGTRLPNVHDGDNLTLAPVIRAITYQILVLFRNKCVSCSSDYYLENLSKCPITCKAARSSTKQFVDGHTAEPIEPINGAVWNAAIRPPSLTNFFILNVGCSHL